MSAPAVRPQGSLRLQEDGLAVLELRTPMAFSRSGLHEFAGILESFARDHMTEEEEAE
jgi:hypothetical protein